MTDGWGENKKKHATTQVKFAVVSSRAFSPFYAPGCRLSYRNCQAAARQWGEESDHQAHEVSTHF